VDFDGAALAAAHIAFVFQIIVFSDQKGRPAA
jgi:hypothetical protein